MIVLKDYMTENAHYKRNEKICFRSHLLMNLIIPLVLLIVTLCTATMSGVFVCCGERLTLSSIFEGVPYALGILITAGAHALGHYIQARLNKIEVYPPYFLPALGIVGTVGAYTKIKWPILDRKVIIKIFTSGPIFGFLAAWLVLIIGLFYSRVADSASLDSSLKMGNSIVMHITSIIIFGDRLYTKDIVLHPLAYAGWLGLCYNFCHLLPIGKFDGGRLVYALWGYKVTKWVSFISIGVLLTFGFLSSDGVIWISVAIVGIISTIGFRGQYPSERYDQPLAKSMLVVLSIIVAIFIVSFTPIPLPILK